MGASGKRARRLKGASRSAGKLRGAEIEPRGGHRIAMAFAVAASPRKETLVIRDADCAGVSVPYILPGIEPLGGTLATEEHHAFFQRSGAGQHSPSSVALSVLLISSVAEAPSRAAVLGGAEFPELVRRSDIEP